MFAGSLMCGRGFADGSELPQVELAVVVVGVVVVAADHCDGIEDWRVFSDRDCLLFIGGYDISDFYSTERCRK